MRQLQINLILSAYAFVYILFLYVEVVIHSGLEVNYVISF